MQKHVLIGLGAFLLIALITLFLPVELYDGEAVYTTGETESIKLSLHDLLQKKEHLQSIPDLEDIRLNRIGWLMIIIVNFGLPVLIGYRFFLHDKQKKSARE
jgi:hypothetical protein